MRRFVLCALLAVAACGSPRPAEKHEEPPPTAFDGAAASNAAATVAHGERLTRVLGCTGCHGKELQGERFYERYASNLTRDLSKYSNADLERLLREGVHPEGRDVWAMPSELFQHLSAPDLAALIAFLRTLQPAGEPTKPPLPFEEETRKLIAKGKLKPAADFVRETKSTTPVNLGESHAMGRYITMVTCAECHGPQLKGFEGDTPDLIVAGGYTRDEFVRLLTQGIPVGGRKLRPLMVDVAKNRFAHLTKSERDALYAYLKARAEQPQ